MKKIIVGALLLMASVLNISLAQAASPSIAGVWNVTFYLEPGRGTGATQCIFFKVASGTVSGVPTSGTWVSPTFPGWSGQWIQTGDHVRFYGLTGSLATTESGEAEGPSSFNGVSFNHFNKNNGLNSSAGSWTAVRVRSCSPNNHSVANSNDPATDGSTL